MTKRPFISDSAVDAKELTDARADREKWTKESRKANAAFRTAMKPMANWNREIKKRQRWYRRANLTTSEADELRSHDAELAQCWQEREAQKAKKDLAFRVKAVADVQLQLARVKVRELFRPLTSEPAKRAQEDVATASEGRPAKKVREIIGGADDGIIYRNVTVLMTRKAMEERIRAIYEYIKKLQQ